MCVGFTNLNKARPGSFRFTHRPNRRLHYSATCVLLDAFSGYHPDQDDDEDIEDIDPMWGMLRHTRLPFGLRSTSATFRRAMYIAWAGSSEGR